MNQSTPDTLKWRLAQYGARGDDCVALHRGRDLPHGYQDPRILRYVDLVRNPQMPLVDVVVEEQSQPLLYVVDAARFTGDPLEAEAIDALRCSLAMRGDQAWLGVLRFGRLDIYATDLKPGDGPPPFKTFDAKGPDALGALPRLAQGEDLVALSELRLREVLLGLMRDAGTALTKLHLTVEESIALTGRALFFRYLVGRGIVVDHHRQKFAPHAHSWEQCFGNAENLASTNTWLDETFNGDLLKLPQKDYLAYFGNLMDRHGKAITIPLQAIMGLDDSMAPGAYQKPLWRDLDFSHVPIGLLSETYEALMQQFAPKARHDTSIYYTPAPIADYMVAEALHQHPNGSGSRARVLDPACGAGVFLVSAFRKLAELRFAETTCWPDRDALRGILNDQLVGFDINSHARTLAALALYLTALELDPDPAPVEALTFKKLEGRVLVDVADTGAQQQASAGPDVSMPMAGSLGEHVSQEYLGAFDLVIGNPPWTSLKSDDTKEGKAHIKKIDQIFTRRCRDVAHERGLEDIAANYENPDKVPDLPFVWAAMQWAKPHGRIALVVAARWLFKMSDQGFAARSALFKAVAITGILNGAYLSGTRVWTKMGEPFSLLFADNRLPEPLDRFMFVSPESEPKLNKKGLMRIDAYDAIPVSPETATTQRSLLKTLYRGTGLDVEIINRIRQQANETVGGFWKPENGLCSGNGFIKSEGLNNDLVFAGMPTLDADYESPPFLVNTRSLQPYQPMGMHRRCDPDIFRAPLVLVREGMREDRDQGRVLVVLDDVVYSKSYFGFSAAGHEDSTFLTHYLLVLLNSQLFEYVTLMSSGKYGVGRRVLQGLDIENFPIILPETLTPSQRSGIEAVAQSLTNNRPEWQELDETVFQLYGLGPRHAQVIADTLETRLPFANAKKRANARVTQPEREAFGVRLQKELTSVLGASGHTVQVQPLPAQGKLPWKFVAVSVGKVGSPEQALPHVLPEQWLDKADDLMVSRITVVDASRALITVGLLDRYRYWTLTQARLLASDILWEHGAMLEQRAE